MGRTISFVGVLLLTACSCLAQEIPPSAAGERVWLITDYLKGTRFQIRDELNKEVVRLRRRSDELSREIADERSSIEKDRALVIGRAMKAIAYLAAAREVAAAKGELDQAHRDHDTSAAMSASSRYNKARDAMEKLESDAQVAANQSEQVVLDRKRLSAANKELPKVREGLAKAEKWRDELREVIRNTYTIRWPLDRGREGLLGEVSVVEIGKDKEILLRYKAQERQGQVAVGEGIANTRIQLHDTRILLTGADPTQFKAGSVMRFDHNVAVVTSGVNARNEFVATAHVQHADIDDLMDAISTDDVTPEQAK